MRLRQRLGERARAALASDPAPAAAPSPEGPTAVYARILDGDSLWLAVVGTDERVALKHEQTGEVVEPGNDAPADPAATSYRWHLPTALPAMAEDADHDVFLLVTRDSAEPLRAEGLPDPAPMRTPPTRDGRWQLDVRRRDGGAVVVRRERRPRAAEVVTIDADDDGLLLRCTDPGLDEPRLVLAAADGLARYETPLARVDGLLSVAVPPEAVPDELEVEWFVSVSDGREQVPLVRRRNDTARPGFATVLPILWTEDEGGRRTVRMRYLPDGRLRLHRPAEGDDPS